MASTTATAAPPRPSPWEQAPKGRGVSQGVILGGYDSRSAFGDGAIEELSDEALLAAFGSGDEKLAAVFVHRFQRQVYAVALSILGDPALSEDVAQQVFERAWRHGSGYDPRLGAVSVWMGAISRNLAIDTARRQRFISIDPEELFSHASASGESTERSVMADLAADDLRHALQTLPLEQARAVVMAGIGGMSCRQIAESERIPLGTAKTRVRTAMGRLRVALGALGSGHE